MDVKYNVSKWDEVLKEIGNILGLQNGDGIFHALRELEESRESVKSNINKYDEDGVVSFSSSSHTSTVSEIIDGYYLLHDYVGGLSHTIYNTIDNPFYQDFDRYVTEMRNVSIANFKTKNRIGATQINTIYHGGKVEYEGQKASVDVEDLFTGDTFYAERIASEWEQVKTHLSDEEFTFEDYQQVVLNTHAFAYDALEDKQLLKEFWGGLIALAVIVTATLVFPPAGIALASVYGTLEVTSAIQGEHWISGRELDTTEQWVQGAFGVLDVVPGLGLLKSIKSVKSFSYMNDAKRLMNLTDNVIPEVKYALSDTTTIANLTGKQRLGNMETYLKERTRQALLKTEQPVLKAMNKADELATNMKKNLNVFSSREEVVVAGFGKVDDVIENTHKVESAATGFYSRIRSSGGGVGDNLNKLETDGVIKNSYDLNGNLVNRAVVPKGYDSVDDFLKVIDDTTIKQFGYDSVEEFKSVIGHVEEYLNVSPKHNILNKGLAGGKHVKGVEYDIIGFPIFKGDDVKFSLKLEKDLFVATDNKQFKECTKMLKHAIEKGEVPIDIFTSQQLDQIEKGRAKIQGFTWHHHQVPGKMQLVIEDIHGAANHLGGNKLWGGGVR